MRLHTVIRLYPALLATVLLSTIHGLAQTTRIACFPANKAKSVNPDTHLVLTFFSTPTLGKSGQIRVYDAADHSLVDTLDPSVPAGPDPTHRIAPVPAQAIDPSPATPTTTTPAVRTTPADLHNYQLTTVGGLADFHFYPVILHGNVATIYLHNNVLRYRHKYSVEIDRNVFTTADGVFAGFTGNTAWTFTTKAAPPAANANQVVVAADGSGDFDTIQGAVDFVPADPPKRATIFVKDGTYEEIVFFRDKANITFRGEDRDKVEVGYGNNSTFNPPIPGPSRRCAFSANNSNGIELSNFTVSNYYFGQAEGLLISGSKNIVSHMNIKGSGDASISAVLSTSPMSWVHWMATEIVDKTLNALIAPNNRSGGRGEMDVENFDRDRGFAGTVSGASQQVGEKLLHFRAAMNTHAEGILPDDVFGVGGDDLLGIELVPPFLFTIEHGANGCFVGGLLSGRGQGYKSKDGNSECDGDTEHVGSSSTCRRGVR